MSRGETSKIVRAESDRGPDDVRSPIAPAGCESVAGSLGSLGGWAGAVSGCPDAGCPNNGDAGCGVGAGEDCTPCPTGRTAPVGGTWAREVVALGGSIAVGKGEPQCWQNLKPEGVWPPQLEQATFDGAAAGAALTGATAPDGAAPLAAATPPEGACCASGDPQFLQNFIPAGFVVPQFPQPLAGGAAPRGLGGSGATKGVPQAWQKRNPSLFCWPHFGQMIILFLPIEDPTGALPEFTRHSSWAIRCAN